MKKSKIPSLISILILTMLTAIVWISLSIYWAVVNKPNPVVPENVSNPLTPTLDTDTMNSLGAKIFLDDSQVPEIKNIPQATAVPTIATPLPVVPTATATPSATPTQIPSPTP